MEMMDVDSSNLKQVGYDNESGILGIVFQSGILYHYYDVPRETFDELMEADSAGKYFNIHIRNIYDYTNEGPA